MNYYYYNRVRSELSPFPALPGRSSSALILSESTRDLVSTSLETGLGNRFLLNNPQFLGYIVVY